jgi:carboxypeptidase Taq
MEQKFNELLSRLREINDLDNANSLLNWDQSTYMPEGGVAGRARQSATLARLSQEKSTDPALGTLIDDLRPYEESHPYDSYEASLIRVARRDFERATKVPPQFFAEVISHMSQAYMVWVQARPANDFKKVQPLLEKTLDYSRQLANYFPGYDHIGDPLIDFADYGMKASSVRKIFAELREQLVPLVNAITSQAPADDSCLTQTYPDDKQMSFGRSVVERLGYDFKRGRIDLTHHPFMTKFALGDIRITTRVNPNDLGECLFSLIHESGHAMYELGIDMSLDGTPLAGGTSAGVHESQSRTWENLVGRSREFWVYFYPRIQEVFPEQLKNVPMETFYRAANKVQRSLIRTEADEVTYNLHVMLRFELEMAMLEGSLEIRDLPEVWRSRYQNDLGISSPDDRNGVMQDVHWYGGIIGGSFQGYTLGNIMGALFYSKALEAHPTIPEQISRGEFDTLRGWLTENIYKHGRKFTATELIQRVTGGDLTIEPYIRYLKTKYGELYKV